MHLMHLMPPRRATPTHHARQPACLLLAALCSLSIPSAQAAGAAALPGPATAASGPVSSSRHAPLPTGPDSDYATSFGGAPGMAALVEDLIARVRRNPRIGERFADTNLKRLSLHLQEQLCLETGGGCAYTGESMRDIHAGQGIGASHFNAMVTDLEAAMRARGIPLGAQYRLLARLAPMHRDMVVDGPVPPASPAPAATP